MARLRHRLHASVAAVATAAALVVTLAEERDARADCTNGAHVGTDCRLRIWSGPVLAPSRVLGLAGAYQAVAEDLAGFAVNAAAPAVRTAYSWDWFDYDLDFSISLPNLFRPRDGEYGGLPISFDYTGWVFLTLGGNVQLGPWGFGVESNLERFDLTPDNAVGAESYRGTLTRTTMLAARQFFDGDLVIGSGFRYVGFSISGVTPEGARNTLVNVGGIAPEIGFLLRPEETWFRFGATYRMGVTTGSPGPNDQLKVNKWTIPQAVNLPWEFDVGFAFQGGPRPLNVHWSNPIEDEDEFRADVVRARERRAAERANVLAATPPDQREARARELAEAEARVHEEEDLAVKEFGRRLQQARRERYDAMPREYILLTLGLLVTGTTPNGISLESFFSQTVARAGSVVTYSPRLGLETELVPNVLRPRIGSYVEPSQFTAHADWKAFRQHLTAGFDLYLFRWGGLFGLIPKDNKWRITTAVDVTNGYWNYGLSFGNWH